MQPVRPAPSNGPFVKALLLHAGGFLFSSGSLYIGFSPQRGPPSSVKNAQVVLTFAALGLEVKYPMKTRFVGAGGGGGFELVFFGGGGGGFQGRSRCEPVVTSSPSSSFGSTVTRGHESLVELISPSSPSSSFGSNVRRAHEPDVVVAAVGVMSQPRTSDELVVVQLFLPDTQETQ